MSVTFDFHLGANTRYTSYDARGEVSDPRVSFGYVETKTCKMRFRTPNQSSRWRVKSFFDKEPETLVWLNSIPRGDLLIDVGANVGMYSIYAAIECGLKVIALEPESQNYALLNENIFYNGVSERVLAYPYAVGDKNGHDLLHLSKWGAAGSCHAAGEMVAFNGTSFSPVFSQGAIVARLDDIVNADLVDRAHLKIDVDGFEPKVVSGACELIESGVIKSLLVEINRNLDSHRALVSDLCNLGFAFSDEQVELSIRRSGPFEGCANYIFARK